MRKKDAYLLVDGYNIIYSWNRLKKIAAYSLEAARDKLLEILSNYAGVGKETVIVVFDAHKVQGGQESTLEYINIKVVYTKEAETADSYIEKTVYRLARDAMIRVATSDGLEQMIILSKGAYRLSARELELEVTSVEKEIRIKLEQIKPIKNNALMDNIDEKTAQWLEKMRRGE